MVLRSWCFRLRLRGRLGDMLFKRKKRLSAVMRLRYAAWPARSFRRSFRYRLLRLLRINASAHSIALGCALGVFAVFTPFLGLQMTIAALLALALGGSVLASAAGSFAGNPLTYPISGFRRSRPGMCFSAARPAPRSARFRTEPKPSAAPSGRFSRTASPRRFKACGRSSSPWRLARCRWEA